MVVFSVTKIKKRDEDNGRIRLGVSCFTIFSVQHCFLYIFFLLSKNRAARNAQSNTPICLIAIIIISIIIIVIIIIVIMIK